MSGLPTGFPDTSTMCWCCVVCLWSANGSPDSSTMWALFCCQFLAPSNARSAPACKPLAAGAAQRPGQREGAQPQPDVGRQRAGLPVQPVAEERLHGRVDHPEDILQRPDGVLAGMPPRSRWCASTAAALIRSGPTLVMMACSRQCSESSMANWSPAALG